MIPAGSKDFILIFLKAPHLGTVKTRLASHVGDERALRVYRALVERQCDALPTKARVEIHFTPNQAEDAMRRWLLRYDAFYPQSDGDLGNRLTHAVSEAFKRGARSVTCIGGDCPELGPRHIEMAQARIHAGDEVVFGPSEDGGYYLISLSKPQPQLFADIPWSEANTLDASLQKAAQLGLKVSLLETLYDVDDSATMDRAIKDGWIE